MNLENDATAMVPLTKTVEGTVGPMFQFAVLYLYSGPVRKLDGLSKYCSSLGMRCTCIDVEFDKRHDLLDQDFWESLESTLHEYDAFMMSPPCSSFTMARSGLDGGPRPLRGTQGRDRYGFKDLRPEDKTKVRQGTLLARRAHRVAVHAEVRRRPWILEQPHWRHEGTSMFMLDEFRELAENSDVAFNTFDQCRYGSKFEKKTDLLSNIDQDIMSPFRLECQHDYQWWIIPWNAHEICSRHPPLRGKQCAIPWNEWVEEMRMNYEPGDEFLTRSTAAYPAEMNEQLAKCLKLACVRSTERLPPAASSANNASEDVDLDPQYKMQESLMGSLKQDVLDESNGLRNIHKWITDDMKVIGKQVQNVIERHLDDHPEIQEELIATLGKQPHLSATTMDHIDGIRQTTRDLLVRNRKDGMSADCSVAEVKNDHYETVIRGELLAYWAEVVQDPAMKPANWTHQGAPAGLECDTSELDGICPMVEGHSEVEIDALHTDYDNFENYTGVEDNEEAWKALESYREKGYLRRFDTLKELERHVQGKPVLSKIGCIIKEKKNPVTNEITTKTRIILDCKRSQVSKAAVRTHKSVLPRVSDAIQSTLAMQSDLRRQEQIMFLVADIVDAFWLVPLRKVERKFFCAKLRGGYYCFHRTAQGSRSAPLTFSVIIGLASRWVQSVVSNPSRQGVRTEEARVQTYVDDPLFTLRGDEQRCRRLTAVIIIAWLIMGFPLAFHKATLSTGLTWIGVELAVDHEGVRASVPREKVLELTELLHGMLTNNVVSKKLLRIVIGKSMSIASVLFCWRPFVQELYRALYLTDTHAPKECVWLKQIRHTVLWLLTFLKGEQAGIVRKYTVRSLSTDVPMITITWDASPFGMGGTLQQDGWIVEYFAIKIDDLDQQILETPSGTHEGQQVWEALAGLISLRLWSKHWQGRRAKLQIRSDNVGALVMLAKLKGGSKQLALIAREYALDLGQAQWKPDVITHIPGIANVTCDQLSRKWDPSKTFQLPTCLKRAREVVPPTRNRSWWKTLSFQDSLESPVRPNATEWG